MGRRLALFASTSLLIVGLVHCVGDDPATSAGNDTDASTSDATPANDGSITGDGGTTSDAQAGTDAGVDAGFVDSCIGFNDCPKNVESTALQLWLRGNIGETCGPDHRLTFWKDQSGASGHDAIGGDAGLPPQCGVAKIGTTDVVTFTAPPEVDAGKFTAYVDETLTTDLTYLDSTAYTLIVVHSRASDSPSALLATDKSHTTGGGGLLCLENGSDPETALFFGYQELTSISTAIAYSEGCANSDFATDLFTSPNTPEVDELVFSESTGHQIFINGVQHYAGDGTNDDLSPLGIPGHGVIGRGVNMYLSDDRYQGNIGEIIVYSVALTTSERNMIHQHLSRQWGVVF